MSPTIASPSSILPSVTIEELVAAGAAKVIDLRSPLEHAHDHLPGSSNIPLFDDDERALIGTLYKQASPAEAFREGRRIASSRVSSLVQTISTSTGWQLRSSELEARVEALTAGGLQGMSQRLIAVRARCLPSDAVVFHCWRGGLRSRSMVALVRGLGMEHAFLLEGGYKAYRRHVSDSITLWCAPPTYVLRGLTGVGKTLVLREIERLHPRWTLDLEALAGHRSSLLGMVGLQPCSQKMFESRFVARARRGFPGVLVVEGESRKVGEILLPPSVWSAPCNGLDIELRAGLERRIAVLRQDYLAHDANRSELREQLPRVEARMHRRSSSIPLVTLLESGREDELIRVLLEEYYDPQYRHSSRDKHALISIDATDPRHAAAEVAEFISEHRAALEREGPACGTQRG